MEKSSLVLDISSDEETDDHDWLSELLFSDEEGKCNSESEEAVIVTDLLPNFEEKSILQDKVVDEDDDDDDCVVLECDPEKLVSVENSKDYDSDDLEIVGEKGEIACRDFPHSRHLCATYQFASTPHEAHCSQCHCYVCDTIAPCSAWGTGTSSIDHCHATDKDPFWRDERKGKKEGNRHVPNDIVTPFSPCIVNLELPAISQPQLISLLPNIVRPVIFRPCYVSSNARTPNVFDQPRHHLLGSSIYKPQPQLVSRRLVSPQLHTTYNNYNAVNRSSRFFPSFKRPGFAGTAPHNRFRYFRSYNGSQLSPERGFHAISTAQLNGCDFPNQQRVDEYVVDYMAAQQDSIPPNYDVPEIHSPSISSCQIEDPPTTHVWFPFQTNLNINGLVAPFQPQVACPPFMASFDNMILTHPRTHASNQSDVSNAFGYMGNSVFENQSSQARSYSNIYPATINGQNDFQQEDQTQSVLDMNAANFGFDWDASHCHGNSQAPAMASQLQNMVPVHNSHNPSILVEENHEHEVAPVANLSLLDSTDCHFPQITSTKPFDVQLDDWMFENPSSPGAYEIPLSPFWNISSPEPGLTDAGFFEVPSCIGAQLTPCCGGGLVLENVIVTFLFLKKKTT